MLLDRAYHLLGDVYCLAENCTKTNSWEDIHVAIGVSTNVPKGFEHHGTLTFPDLAASLYHREDMVGMDYHSRRWLCQKYAS